MAESQPPVESGSSTELAPIAKAGHLDHLFMAEPGSQITRTMSPEDIMEVNWDGVISMIRQAEHEIRHEGQFDPVELQDVINVVAMAVRRLSYQDLKLESTLRSIKAATLTELLLALFPERGASVRKSMRTRREAKRDRSDLAEVNAALTVARESLAAAVDERLHQRLTMSDQKYSNTVRALETYKINIKTCQDFVKDMSALVTASELMDAGSASMARRDHSLTYNRIMKKLQTIYYFYKNMQGELVVLKDNKTIVPEKLLAGLQRVLAKLEAERGLLSLQLKEWRDREKEKLYRRVK